MSVRGCIVAHGGAGSPSDWKDGPESACKAGSRCLASGGSALDAVEIAVALLEDDPRFNAGTGSVLRLDGSIEMDAAIMRSEERRVGKECRL